jgi:histidinol-phosphate aminotransferase
MTQPQRDLTKLIRQDIQSMHAYAIQPSAGLVKLDAMENPHRLAPELQAELGRRLGALALNRYPAGQVDDLRRALAAYAGMPDGFDIMLGNGSDELISLVAMACDVAGASILAPLPGFVMYAMSAQLQGLKFVGVDLTPDFELDEQAMLAAIAQHQPSIIYLAYPNNPTANLWDDAVIDRIIAAAPGLVVIDEAYQPFSSRSYIDRVARHSHVLLMRTMSKFGLAGVRIGYMMGPQALVAQFDKVRPPYNISACRRVRGPGQGAARAAFAPAGRTGAIARRQGLAQRRQHDPGALSRRPEDLRRPEGARLAGQERF